MMRDNSDGHEHASTRCLDVAITQDRGDSIDLTTERVPRSPPRQLEPEKNGFVSIRLKKIIKVLARTHK